MTQQLHMFLEKTADGVWVKPNVKDEFGYTDGAWVEKYLTRVFESSDDLSSRSYELEKHIHEWNTEYHLTRKRKNLLSNLTYDRDHEVLEIGCGCGAITRFLGETFNSVTAVEGSYERAKLARLRTKDLESVEVVNSRFQELSEIKKFDAIFCIGVWEYSPSYVSETEPFEAALDAMKAMLKPDGYLVLAIENQFGLKYFANSREDHSGTFFEGIEGYPRMGNKFQTFGRAWVEKKLSRMGENIDFYYPFPDYKIPDALLSEDFFDAVNCGELLGALTERDYAGQKPPFFDNRLAWPEVAKNNLVADLANSFLVVVGGDTKPGLGNSLGFLYNSERLPQYCTTTSFERNVDGEVVAIKKLDENSNADGKYVQVKEDRTEWLHFDSISFSTFKRYHNPELKIEEVFVDVKHWWTHLVSLASQREGKISGEYIDLSWQNSIYDGKECHFFDRELVWHSELDPKLILARASFLWLSRMQRLPSGVLSGATLASKIKRIGSLFDVTFTKADLSEIASIEAMVQHEIGGKDLKKLTRKVKAQLYLPYYFKVKVFAARLKVNFLRGKNLARRILRKFT